MNAVINPASHSAAAAPRFPMGRVVATPGALRALEVSNTTPLDLLTRHVRGDWGDVPTEDAHANERALNDDARLLSSFLLSTGERLWIITECDRSVTTLLLPCEY